jgi:Fe-Mn family superoxide dismutase
MTITLTPLPYADTALAPTISVATLQTHHSLHHRAYVDNVNAAIKGGPHAIASLATIISAADAAQDHKLFNDAAQAWNHGFYWFSLCADQQEPDAGLAAAIERDFGSLALLKEELVAQGMAHFGSGWVWLVRRGTALSVEQTHDAASFAVAGPGGDAVPLLVVDLWEHAYYLDYRNVRKNHLKQVIGGHLNWAFASENFARNAAWVYPDFI